MPVLRNARHERFCQLLASGKFAMAAYREAAGKKAGKPENDHVHSAEWKQRRGVRERIRELIEANSKKSVMNREELMAFYSQVILTPADQVPVGSPVIQAYEMTESGPKIRLADKIAAGAQLSKMTGWNEPEQVRLSGTDSLSRYLLELRAQPIGGRAILPLERHALFLGNGENSEEGL
jgi:predicted RNA-binding Zn ribbon-like protein